MLKTIFYIFDNSDITPQTRSNCAKIGQQKKKHSNVFIRQSIISYLKC